MESAITISYILYNALIICYCIVIISWAAAAIHTLIADHKREKKKALQDDESHAKRMESYK